MVYHGKAWNAMTSLLTESGKLVSSRLVVLKYRKNLISIRIDTFKENIDSIDTGIDTFVTIENRFKWKLYKVKFPTKNSAQVYLCLHQERR